MSDRDLILELFSRIDELKFEIGELKRGVAGEERTRAAANPNYRLLKNLTDLPDGGFVYLYNVYQQRFIKGVRTNGNRIDFGPIYFIPMPPVKNIKFGGVIGKPAPSTGLHGV